MKYALHLRVCEWVRESERERGVCLFKTKRACPHPYFYLQRLLGLKRAKKTPGWACMMIRWSKPQTHTNTPPERRDFSCQLYNRTHNKNPLKTSSRHPVAWLPPPITNPNRWYHVFQSHLALEVPTRSVSFQFHIIHWSATRRAQGCVNYSPCTKKWLVAKFKQL